MLFPNKGLQCISLISIVSLNVNGNEDAVLCQNTADTTPAVTEASLRSLEQSGNTQITLI
jgi:hypothetical protein